MSEFHKYIELIWKVPLAAVVGYLGYGIVKQVAVTVLYANGTLFAAKDATTVGTILPLVVPISSMIWAFSGFIFPKKKPPINIG